MTQVLMYTSSYNSGESVSGEFYHQKSPSLSMQFLKSFNNFWPSKNVTYNLDLTLEVKHQLPFAFLLVIWFKLDCSAQPSCRMRLVEIKGANSFQTPHLHLWLNRRKVFHQESSQRSKCPSVLLLLYLCDAWFGHNTPQKNKNIVSKAMHQNTALSSLKCSGESVNLYRLLIGTTCTWRESGYLHCKVIYMPCVICTTSN